MLGDFHWFQSSRPLKVRRYWKFWIVIEVDLKGG